MKKMLFLFIVLVSIFLFRKLPLEQHVENENSGFVRLADDYNGDWDKEAIGYLKIDKEAFQETQVALIDTGCNLVSKQIALGYNACDNTTEVSDRCNHGTVMAKKLLELNPNILITPIKVTDDKELLSDETLIEAIEKAITLNVDIISISLGVKTQGKEVQDVVEKAINKGIVIVAAAGNGGQDILYPAKYTGVISVMARDINNIDLSFNGKNKDKKSFSAPGEHIKCGNEYYTGTSIATVYLTASVAYVKSNIQDVNLEDLRTILMESSMYPTEFSYGLINYNKLSKNVKARIND